MKVVILVPTYNEKENIGKLLKELLELTNKLKKYRFKILIVDSSSPDGTGKIVKEYRSESKNIVLLTDKKEGLGKSMIRGYLYAMEKLKADVVVTNEADFAYDMDKHLQYMLDIIDQGFDLIVASRHVGIGKTEGWTLSRKLNHFIANKLFATWIAGVSQVYDHNGAFRAVRVRGVLNKIDLRGMKVRGFAFFFISLYRFTCVTDKIDEFPATYRFRIAGESKISFNPKYVGGYLRDIAEYVKLAFKVRLERCRI